MNKLFFRQHPLARERKKEELVLLALPCVWLSILPGNLEQWHLYIDKDKEKDKANDKDKEKDKANDTSMHYIILFVRPCVLCVIEWHWHAPETVAFPLSPS
jgi:hypothetical protein